MNIIIEKIPGGFQARHVSGCCASGLTWMEAVGALVATNPRLFSVTMIAYSKDATTLNYVIERGLNERITSQ